MSKLSALRRRKAVEAVSATPNPIPFQARATIFLVAQLGSTYVALVSDGPIWWIATMVLGLSMAHGTELSHQALHETAFKSPLLNRIFGIYCSAPTGVSFDLYKWLHLRHHRFNGTALDAESFSYEFDPMMHAKLHKRLLGFAYHILMIGHWKTVIGHLFSLLTGQMVVSLADQYPAMNSDKIRAVRNDFAVCTALIISAVAAGFVFDYWQPLTLWLCALAAWGVIHALIELPEHWQTAARPNSDPFMNTRTICAGAALSYFVNGNSWHVEHHLAPKLPMHTLRSFHTVLREDGHDYHYLQNSYAGFYRDFFTALLRGPKQISLKPTKS